MTDHSQGASNSDPLITESYCPSPDLSFLMADEIPVSLPDEEGPDEPFRKRPPVTVESLVEEIKQTADKLARDNAAIGDIKIIARAIKELRYAFKVFTPYRQHRKVTVFGSARLKADHPSYQQSVEFGRRMAELGWMVLTGAGGGIMEGAHVGAGRDMAMGLNIMLPFEQAANPVIAQDHKLVNLKYFFTRKLMFVKEVGAVVLFPGGFGTQDECFETLTLIQTGKHELMPIVCVDESTNDYWAKWRQYLVGELLSEELISPEDLSLFKVTNSVDEAIAEVLHFYRIYHSMRFVRGKLVLRLTQDISDSLLERLNTEFADLLISGQIERTTAHKQESDELESLNLPRLALDFDRKKIGRLRQLVDVVNNEA